MLKNESRGDIMNIPSEKLAFDHLLDISMQLSSEESSDILMEKILMAAMEVANADAGSIYMVTDSHTLEFQTIINKSLNLHIGGSSKQEVNFPAIPLFINDEPNKFAIVAHTVNTASLVNIDDVYDVLPFDFSAARHMDKVNGYRTKSMLTLPLKDHTGDIVGAVQLINAMKGNEIIRFNKQIERQILSFASLGAIALTNRTLINNMEALFESFAKTIAVAIDAKSPHTGKHCERVPKLTLMMADATHLEKNGPLGDFKLSEQDRYQLEIAGWLHDCGKIATPDHIIEKETKLQTIFDRIEYVNAKLEIVSRDIEIDYQSKIIAALQNNNTEASQRLLLEKEAKQKTLNEDRMFLQRINVGAEFLTSDQEKNIHTIAARYKVSIMGKTQALLNDDEVMNLSIKRGTLNHKERLKIQEHMDVTQDILETLPFPKQLSNVIEYALGHHERMDGTGYPKGLTKEQMSVPARLMAVADVFEALSAADRPYKKAKSVSECLTIMGRMVLNNHLDEDLFTIFVRSKVYEPYIIEFADPEQLDEFDIEDIPGLQHYDTPANVNLGETSEYNKYLTNNSKVLSCS